MKTVNTIIALILTMLSAPHQSHASEFQGKWNLSTLDDNGNTTSTLTIKIADKGNALEGSYCFISRSGDRIDCPINENNLIGHIEKQHNRAQLTINPKINDYSFKAQISKDGEDIILSLQARQRTPASLKN